MENGTYRKTESCQRYRDWAQALKRNYEAVTAEQSTVSRARDLSTSTRTAQVDPQLPDTWLRSGRSARRSRCVNSIAN